MEQRAGGINEREQGESMGECALLSGVGSLTARHQVTIFLFVSAPRWVPKSAKGLSVWCDPSAPSKSFSMVIHLNQTQNRIK